MCEYKKIVNGLKVVAYRSEHKDNKVSACGYVCERVCVDVGV